MAEKVGEIFYDVTLDTGKLLVEVRVVTEQLDRVGREGEKLQSRMSKIAAAISAALSAIAVEALVQKVITAQRQFDVMFASLKTMTGGLDQASAAYERLTKFAAQTPFTLKQSVDGFVKLKALGLDPSERAMTSFGNTASAMGKDLTQMIEAVADASTGEFERLKEFGIKAKQEGDKVSLTFQGVTTTIGNNARDITEYLIKIGETNFAGAMAERMNTLDGNISNLQDSLDGLFLSIAQSGFGDAVAAGVRKASEAIGELTTSIKQGELTDYFSALKPLITAAEVAVISLAGAFSARLIVAFVSAAAQAYATATAIGFATVAANGFTAALAALGGPIGIAITGLALLALNWDKVAGEARDAATMSEDAAGRIAKALGKGGVAAGKALSGQLGETQAEIASINKELANTKFPLADPKQLDELRERKATLEQIAKDVVAAQAKLGAPPPGAPPPPPPPSGGTGGKGAKKKPFDSAGYLAGLSASAASEWDKVDEVEKEALRKNAEHLKAGDLSRKESEQAITLIVENARQDREKIMDKEADAAKTIRHKAAADQKADADKLAAQQKAAVEYAANLTRAINPVDALRQELQAKLSLVTQYETMMAQAGVDATAQGQAARTQIESDYEKQRRALAEATFRGQSESNAFLIDSLNALSSTGANAVVGLLNGTMSVSDAMRSLANTVLSEAVSALARVGLEMLKNSVLSNTLAAADQAKKAAMGAVYAASVGAQVAGMSALAAQNAFAATAAIPIIGPGLAPAAAAAAGAAAAAIGAPAIASAPLAGARRYGGPVDAGGMYRVNESGAPELFTGSNGQQYMLPTKSGQVTPAGQAGGAAPTIIIQNTGTAKEVTSQSYDQQTNTMKMVMADLVNQFASNTGPVWNALRGGSNLKPGGIA